MKNLTPRLLASAFFAGTAGASELRDEVLELFAALPSTVPNVADKPTSPEKADLGRALLFDPRLSASGVLSCSGWSKNPGRMCCPLVTRAALQ